MKFIKYKKFLNNKKWLALLLVCFTLLASYASAVSFAKDPEVGVMVPANDYEPAWYINPITKEKIVLVEPLDAFRAMKKFGLGIKHATLEKYFKIGFPKNLAGTILIDTQLKGQAYYISALDLKAYFLGSPDFALIILREHGFRIDKQTPTIKLDNPLAEVKKKTLPVDNTIIEEDKNTTNPLINDSPTKSLIVTTNSINSDNNFSKIISVSASIINETGSTITEKGIIWSEKNNPSLELNDGLIRSSVVANNFSVNVDGIIAGRTYYFKAYAKVGDKVFYGNEEKFVSPQPVFSGTSPAAKSLPTINTDSLSLVGDDALSSGGALVDDGGGQITSKGICWSTTSNPTTNDSCTDEGAGMNNFTSSINNINPDAMYYVRAYAINSVGTSYGNEVVTCGSATVKDADDNNYNVVKIGTQCWMKENLNVGTMIGAALADGSTAQGQSNNNVIEKYCYGYVQQDNLAQVATGAANCAVDGALYEWPEAMGLPYDCKNAPSVNNGDGTYTLSCPTSGSQTVSAKQRGICPLGWHVPTLNDYQLLSQRADPSCDLPGGACTTAGGKLKVTPTYSPVAWDGTDIYNFSVMPTGYLYYLTFSHHRDHAPFWTTSPDLINPTNSWGFGLTAGSSSAYADPGNNRTDGFAVRCIKD